MAGARGCKACLHASREEIDALLTRGEGTAVVAKLYGFSPAVAVRHQRRCIGQAFERAREARATDVAEKIAKLQAEAQRQQQQARADGDPERVLLWARERRLLVELEARVRGEVKNGSETNVVNFNLDAATAERMAKTFLARRRLELQASGGGDGRAI